MAKLARWIEPKPTVSAHEAVPLVLLPLTRRPTIAISTQIIPGSVFVDGQSLQSNMNSNREALRQKLATRPARGYLVQRGILFASSADSLIQKKAEVLKRCKLKDKLNKKLQHRPGPLELVTKKILQADAELEQAIQEGRILFTKTSDVVERETHSQHLPYAAMEVISTTSACSPNSKPSNSCVAKSKVRKKTHQCRTPYEQTPSSPNCAKPKLKVATSPGASKAIKWRAEGNSTHHIQPSTPDGTSGCTAAISLSDDESTQVQSSYDLLLQQQRLFLQWQKEVEDARGSASRAANEEVRFSSVQEDQIRGSPSEGCSLSETSPCAVQLTDSAHSNSEYAYDSDSRTLMCEQPVVELCCQSSAAAPTTNETPPAVVARPSSTAYSERDKPKLKLSDYRVQDLKNECKKRQLPVSGAKPQLVERLKPFEEAILGANADDAVRDVLSTTSPASEWSNGAKRLPPISNVISDYIQQNFAQVPQQMAQLQPLVLHVPAVSQNQQLLHLVDSNGSLVAMATVPSGVQCCRVSSDCPCDAQGVGTTVAHYEGSERTELPAQAATSVQTEPTFSFAQLGSGGQFTLVQSTSSGEANRQSGSPTIIDDAQQCSTQRVIACPQPCGAQLTRTGCCSVQPASPNVQPCGGTVLGAVQSAQFGNTPTNTQLVAANQTQIVPAQSIQMLAQPLQLSSGQLVPTGAVSSSQPCFVTPGATNDSIQYTHYVVSVSDQLQPSRQDGTLQTQSTRCLPMQTAVPPPGCSPVTGDSASGSSPNIPSPPTKLDSATRSQDIHTMQIDPNDTNALLSATTLSIHEEMLRFQQRKIEELQKELNRSQQQLKHQQQVILAAKRAQQTKRHECAQQKNEGEQSQADMWLNQLDIKHLNKFHIQLFLQHKLQQQQMQEQLLEQQKLTTTEQKLQEELHVEQAVQDIVRLIKQDARTALLIVQLLRRYQLERGRQAANAAIAAVNGDCMNSANNLADEQQEQRQAMICIAESSAASNTEEIAEDVNVKRASVGINGEEECIASASNNTHSKPKSKKKNVTNRCTSSKTEANDRKEKPPTAQVDMEEIFRKVLEDASRALLLSNANKEDETATGAASEEVLDTHSNTAAQPSDTLQHEHQQVLFSSETPQEPLGRGQFADSFAPAQGSPAFFVGEEKMPSECMDDRYKERVEVIEEGAVMLDQPMQYSKNQAFDDLMDVLRDDQVTEADVRRPEHDFATGADYESNELATLLDGGWFDNESVTQPSVAYEAPCVGYAHDGPNELTDDIDSRDRAEHNDSVMGCFEQNQLSDQNINMDWLDMMLPSPTHETMGVQPLYNQMVADADILG